MKKNYIDPTAGFFYILGCSLVHFSMGISMIFIKWPNLEQAKALDALHTGEHKGHTVCYRESKYL